MFSRSHWWPALLILVSCLLSGQDFYVLDRDNDLHEVITASRNSNEIVRIRSFFLDITFGTDGNLYGIRGNGNLYRVDTLTGDIALVHVFEGRTYNSMTTSADGTIFVLGTSGELRSFNIETNEVDFYGITNAQVGGDLTFVNGQLLLGGLGNRIYRLDLSDLENSTILFEIARFGQITGLTSVLFDCNKVVTYAFVTGLPSGMTDVYAIDVSAGTFELFAELPYIVNGAASIYEPYNSRVDPLPLRIDSVLVDLPDCSVPFSDINIAWSNSVGNTGVFFDGIQVDSSGRLSDVMVGAHQVFINDAIGCVDSLDWELDCTTSTSNFSSSSNNLILSCYPVPVTSSVVIELAEPLQHRKVQLFSISGQLVNCDYAETGNLVSINMSGVKSGVYIVNIGREFFQLVKQ